MSATTPTTSAWRVLLVVGLCLINAQALPLNRNVRDCSEDKPCGLCEGDCDNDRQCADGLICFRKDVGPTDRDDFIPGCTGIDTSYTDWCILAPTDAPVPAPTDAPVPAPTEAPVPAPSEPTDAPVPASTDAPVTTPQDDPTDAPVPAPQSEPTDAPVPAPTDMPQPAPTDAPQSNSTEAPMIGPTDVPKPAPTDAPQPIPTDAPQPSPTDAPQPAPTDVPLPAPTDAPQPSPTDVPVLIPSTRVPLVRSVRDCSPTNKCGRCEGDCDNDDHCAGNLVCFQKNKGPTFDDKFIPSCLGVDDASFTDWCVDPNFQDTPTPPTPTNPPPTNPPQSAPQPAPTNAPVPGPSGRIPLNRNVRDCSPPNRCGRCEGHCVNDDHCAGNLVCFQKDLGPSDNDKFIPSCLGIDDGSFTNWCVDPDFQDAPTPPTPPQPAPTNAPVPGPSTWIPLNRNVRICSPTNRCGRCEGHCVNNDHCSGNLVCFQKDVGPTDNDKFIPGCLGVDVSLTDWCVDPNSPSFNPPTPPPQSGGSNGGELMILAYYYPWYHRGDWTRHGLQGNKPLLGFYGTDEPTVAEQHNEWAVRAGIDAWVVSWWGAHHQSDNDFFDGMLRANNLNKMKFCMLYELGALPTFNFNDPRAINTLINDMRYFRDNFFHRPQYVRVNGRPVVVLYLTRSYQNFNRGMVQRIKDEVGVDIFFIGDTPYFGHNDNPATATNGIGSDGQFVFEAYTAYNMFTDPLVRDKEPATEYMFRHGLPIFNRWAAQTTFFPQVLPMYHDFRGHPQLVGTPSQMRQQLEVFACLNKPQGNRYPNMLFMTSWNEWWEGSQLEPDEAGRYGFSFIDELRRFKDAGPANC